MQVGTRLGRYEFVTALGKGGMGEVYLARDTSVGRDVALKVLPQDLLADVSRLKRLRREARLLASLNHPNIAALYGFEEDHGVPFLVLELVSGETLAERLRRGPLPLRAALEVGSQIAAALTAAHRRGIVHRDLKPSNVMLTPEGNAKLLDFGVARREPSADSDADTTSDDFKTARGQLVGTLAYMSPEQVRGLPSDQRCDVWAFGCLLYEAITARHPFTAATSTDLVAAILEREPDWRSLERCPAKVRDLVKRCLRKDRDQRLHHMADARIEIGEVLEGDLSGERVSVSSQRARPWRAVAAAVGTVALVSLALLLRGRIGDMSSSEPVRRFTIELDGTLAFGIDYPASVAIAPDGEQIAFVAESGGERRIHVRALDELRARPLDGTRGAQQPFFSPDGRWLGFFADGKLKKISVRGGAPVVLSPAPRGMGGAWSPEGWIVFAPSDFSGLRRVSENGGEAQVFSQVKLETGEQAHWSPVLLPEQRMVLFTVWTGGRNTDSRLAIQAAGQTNHRIFLEGGSDARLLPPRWLIYGRGSELLAAEFDPSMGMVKGTPFRVLEGVQDTPALGAPIFTVSDQGTLVYALAAGSRDAGRIIWLDRKGRALEEIEGQHTYYRPRLSPDRTAVAFHSPDPDFNVWVKDLTRGTRLRLTKEPGWDGFAVWSPDGGHIVFSSAREGSRTLFLQAADGSGPAERLLRPGNSRWPTSWSPDGALIAFDEDDPRTGRDIWLLEMTQRRAQPLLRTAFDEAWARFSPDGEWIAYHSNDSGSFEVYVCPVKEPGRRRQVSAGGGTEPIWSPAGDQIYYNRGTQFVAVPIRIGKFPEPGRPEVLFPAPGLAVNDVNARGDRFLAVDAPSAISINRLHLVLGWRQIVARVAAGR